MSQNHPFFTKKPGGLRVTVAKSLLRLVEGVGGAGPGFLILVMRATCRCLSGFWRDRAGILFLRRLSCPSFP